MKGDQNAYRQLYEKCFPVLMKVCARYQRQEEEAVNLLNEGFLRITQGLAKYRTEVPFEAWIRRIMINTAIDAFRRNRQYRQLTRLQEEPVESHREVILNEGEKDLILQDIYRLIQALPPMTREVFNLQVIDGYTHQEVSNMLGISTGTSKWHVANARKLLQTAIRAIQTPESVPNE